MRIRGLAFISLEFFCHLFRLYAVSSHDGLASQKSLPAEFGVFIVSINLQNLNPSNWFFGLNSTLGCLNGLTEKTLCQFQLYTINQHPIKGETIDDIEFRNEDDVKGKSVTVE